MKRFFTWLKALFGFAMDRVEDPMIMIDQAKRDMQAALIKNQERGVQALTQKNNLQAMVSNVQAQIKKNEAQAGVALKQRNAFAPGTPEYIKFNQLALQFAGELQTNQAQLTTLQATLAQATAACDNVKKALENQQAQFRNKLAEAASLKAQYKSAQVQNAITKALDEFNVTDINQGFGAAAEKVQNMQSEAAARTELSSNSLAGRVMELESATHDMEAQTALSDLEQRLGLAQPVATTPTATVSVNTGAGSADDALNALSQRLGGN